MSAPTAPRPRWLFGPRSDFLLGYGGGYFLFFLVFALLGGSLMGVVPNWVMLMILLFAAVPHYGATLVRAYERPADRRKYRLFTVWAAIGIWSVFVASVYDVTLGSWFLTLNLTWSPWHYSGQNYGIGLMMLGRRGVSVTPSAKRMLYASFLLSWILVVLGTHSAVGTASYTPTPVSASDSAYVFIPLGIPMSIVGPGILVTGTAYLASLVAAFVALRRGGAALRDLSPMLGLIALQAVWFSIPVVARLTGSLQAVLPFANDYQSYILLWMALAHSTQYLWVTTYYAHTSQGETRRLRYWTKIYLAGATTFAIPVFLFSPDLLGVYTFDEGLGLLVVSAVNLHHFVLDGAIWKLRDGRIARVLLRSPRDKDVGEVAVPTDERSWAWAWVGPTLVASGIAYGLFTLVGTWELEWGFRRALETRDIARMETAARRMSWVGRSNFALHYDLGVLAFQRGDFETAEREVARSLELAPKPEAWVTLARIHGRQGEWSEALAACESALSIDSENIPALSHSARALIRLGRPAAAQEILSRAVEIAPERRDLREHLRRLSEAHAAKPSPAGS